MIIINHVVSWAKSFYCVLNYRTLKTKLESILVASWQNWVLTKLSTLLTKLSTLRCCTKRNNKVSILYRKRMTYYDLLGTASMVSLFVFFMKICVGSLLAKALLRSILSLSTLKRKLESILVASWQNFTKMSTLMTKLSTLLTKLSTWMTKLSTLRSLRSSSY